MGLQFNTLLRALMSSAASAVVQGGIKSIVLADSTAIDPVSSVGASGSGWVAIVTLKGLTSLVGTVVGSALTLNVTDPGYDTSGNVTSVSRTITGVAHLRRQYPNGNSKMISTDGTDLTIYVTLDDWVYAGTSIVSASIGGTFYPSCVASAAPVKLNLSTLAYIKPIFGWATMQQQVASGNSYSVEGMAFHRDAMNGQMVACIAYQANDGTNYSTEVVVGSTIPSTVINKLNVPDVFSGSVDMTSMTASANCNIHAKVYPWIGDSTAILDTAVSGFAWPTILPCTALRVVCDRTGSYAGGYAYVQNSAVGGTVSATPATARAAPFPSLHTALAAIKVWNNANRGHNDVGGGIVRMMDTGGVDTTILLSASSVDSPGIGACIIEKDPLSSAVITLSVSSSLKQHPSNLLWRNLTLKSVVAAFNFAGYNHGRDTMTFDNVVFDNTAAQVFLTWVDNPYVYNCVTVGTNCDLLNNGTTAKAAPMVAGTDSTATTGWFGGANTPIMAVGNKNSTPSNLAPTAPVDGFDGLIWYNNRYQGAVNVVLTQSSSPKSLTTFGVAIIQNLIESTNTRSSIAFNAFADGDISTIHNYLSMYNTAVGARCSRMYNDVAATRIAPNGMQKRGVSKHDIYDNYNIKTDTFSAGVGGPGNWAYEYSVGNVGNVSLFGAVQVQVTDAPHNDNTDTPYLGHAWLPSSEYNLRRLLSEAAVLAQFTNFTVTPAAGNVVGGDYRPVAGATYIKNRVPVGKSGLARDISGAVRMNDGSGAAGAYEAAP